MIKIFPLGINNFYSFIDLLKQRGETPKDYYRWKYLDQPSHDNPTGYIAYLDDKPVGCIGIINRVYHTEDGIEYPATWFADWFVSQEARGMGIGVLLMKKVADLSPHGVGIPGPEAAQIIAGKAGYMPSSKVYADIIIPLNRWRTGFERFNGNIIKKILRGVREIALGYSPKEKIDVSNWYVHLKFPEINELKILLNQKTYFFSYSDQYLNWFSCMPIKSERNWWFARNGQFFALGYCEKDLWGLMRLRILAGNVFDVVLELAKLNKVDYCTFFLSQSAINDSVPNRLIKHVPLFTLSESTRNILALDRENIWLDQYMNSK